MDLRSSYLGLSLKNPLVASASPLTRSTDAVRRLADSGVAAIVLHSLFEEQLEREAQRSLHLATAGTESFAESLSYFPSGRADVAAGAQAYLHLLERSAASAASAGVPVIASLNGLTPGSFAGFAHSMQDAGAAAIELNIYYVPGDPTVSGREVEQRHVDVLQSVKDRVGIPVAVKLSPFFSSPGEMALRLDAAGADGLVLFNRFLQPDVDPESLTVGQAATLSYPSEARPARTWIALLAGRVNASLAATTGVDSAADVAKYLLAGADVVMTASALLRYGTQHAGVLLAGLTEWLQRKGFSSVGQARGLLSNGPDNQGALRQRSLYVEALAEANSSSYGPWGWRW